MSKLIVPKQQNVLCIGGWFEAIIRDRPRYPGQKLRNRKILSVDRFHNGTTTAGRSHVLETEFNGGTPVTTWYTGLIDNAGFSALSAADTMSSHGGWTELEDYDEATRPEWTAGSAASGVITNASEVVFTASGSIAINGIFITSVNTKGGTTGTLFTTGSFASVRNLTVGQTVGVTYTLTLADG